MRAVPWIGFGALLFGGCVIRGSEESATEHFRFDAGEAPRVVAHVVDGSLEIVGTDSREVLVTVIKKARAPTPEAASALLGELIVDARKDEDTVRIEVRRGVGWSAVHGEMTFGPRALSADVELRVPRRTDLDLLTHDGRIVVEHLEGRLEAETYDGRLRLRDIRGEVRARSSDGSIVGRDLEGDFDVSTGDGRIELDGRFRRLKADTADGSIRIRCRENTPSPEGDWIIRSSDGSIVLTLPEGLSADIDASTSDGRIVNELPLSEPNGARNWLKGKLGGGGNLIYVKTSEGRVTLRSR